MNFAVGRCIDGTRCQFCSGRFYSGSARRVHWPTAQAKNRFFNNLTIIIMGAFKGYYSILIIKFYVKLPLIEGHLLISP